MISTFYAYLEAAYLSGPYLIDTADGATNSQFSRFIDREVALGTQYQQRIEDSDSFSAQVSFRLAKQRTIPTQIALTIERETSLGSQIQRRIAKSNDVLTQVSFRLQKERNIRTQYRAVLHKEMALNAQIERRIQKADFLLTQVLQRIEKEKTLFTQLGLIVSFTLRTQLIFAIYNAKNLRILSDFASRGSSGLTWTVISGGTETGHFDANNLNTDIVEEVYRSTSTSITIQCDTEIPQGVFNDTAAILNHNFTTSAVVLMQGSNDVGFSSVGFSENLTVERENMYWVSQIFPQNSYRYWRFTITDPTNTQNLQIGCIVFGSSVIFNGECFIDNVVRRKTHFADRVRTEGFTSVSNDRALKRAVSLTFRNLNFNLPNYANLSEIIDEARTSLKCLWIPTPEYSSRFAVFGKLAEIPVETHRVLGSNADYIDLDITVDEAL